MIGNSGRHRYRVQHYTETRKFTPQKPKGQKGSNSSFAFVFWFAFILLVILILIALR